MKTLKTSIIVATIITILSSFMPPIASVYPNGVDGEFVMANVKVRIIGLDEYNYTLATSNFYDVRNMTKEYYYEVYVDSISLMFANTDTTYKYVDSTFMDINRHEFTWSFVDLTDTNSTIRYTTTKALARVDSFNLSTVNSITKTNGFSYSHPLVHADSIVYVLGADSLTSLRKTIVGQSSGVIFTPTELNALANTNQGAFIIMIFNVMPQTYNGKQYYFQNNSTAMVMPLPIN